MWQLPKDLESWRNGLTEHDPFSRIWLQLRDFFYDHDLRIWSSRGRSAILFAPTKAYPGPGFVHTTRSDPKSLTRLASLSMRVSYSLLKDSAVF